VTATNPQPDGPWPVFDSHCHAFPDKVAEVAIPKLASEGVWMDVRPFSDGTLSGLIEGMDRAGIRRALLCSVATRPEQLANIIQWSVAIGSDRIIPFASVHPDCEDPEGAVRQVAASGLKGLKFHSQYMNCALDDPRTLRIARAAAKADLAMTFHSGYDLAFEADDLAGPERLRRLHEAAPDLRMIACHMGGWRQWEGVLEHVAGLPIYFETSFSLGQCPPDVLARLLDAHPREYLLFGTDSPWADPAEELARFMALDLPDEVKRAALWENPHRYLKMPLPE
jgi:uncharacterized protein